MNNIDMLDELPLEVAVDVWPHLYGGTVPERNQDVERMAALLRAYKPPAVRTEEDAEEVNDLPWPQHLTFEINGAHYVCESVQGGTLRPKVTWVRLQKQADWHVRAKCQLDSHTGVLTVVMEVNSPLMGCMLEAPMPRGESPVAALERVHGALEPVYAEVVALQDTYELLNDPSSELCLGLHADEALTLGAGLPDRVRLSWRESEQCWGWQIAGKSARGVEWLPVGSLAVSWAAHVQKSLHC